LILGFLGVMICKKELKWLYGERVKVKLCEVGKVAAVIGVIGK